MDTHAHLNSFDSRNLDTILQRALNAGLKAIMTVGTSLEDWDAHQKIAHDNSNVFFALGVHPTCVNGFTEKLWLEKFSILSQGNCDKLKAIGEIGLDYYHLEDDKEKALQHHVFAFQLEQAKNLDLPVIIHCRDSKGNEAKGPAFNDLVAILKESGIKMENVCMHCFSYGLETLKFWNLLGARASFTGVATYSSSEHIRQALAYQSRNLTMLETDCPYLLPETIKHHPENYPHPAEIDREVLPDWKNGRANEPAFVVEIARLTANIWKCFLDEVLEKTRENAYQFFKIK